MGDPVRIGEHMILCEDLWSEEVTRVARFGADIVYTDPPWGDGLIKMFHTMNRKMTGKEVPPRPYCEFLVRLVVLSKLAGARFVLLETGLRWADETRDALAASYPDVKSYKVSYKSGGETKPSALIAAAQHALPSTFNPEGMAGKELPLHALLSLGEPGQTVMDFCCGFGATAKAALQAKMRFVGNEFNAKRLERTEQVLLKAAG